MHRILLSLLLLPAVALAADSPVPPELLADLQDANPSARIRAIKNLSKLGLEAVPPLVKALRDEETKVSQSAAYALSLLRVEPGPFVAALKPHLTTDAVAVRNGVTMALRRGGISALPALQTALADREPAVRKTAVLSLEVIVARTPTAAGQVLPVLSRAGGDTAAPVRVELARMLARCGPAALELLQKLGDDSDARVRAYALASLMRVKVPAEKVAPLLTKRARDDEDPSVRQSALRTLGALGKAGVPAATAALADKDPAVQKAAVRALAAIGPDAKSAVLAVQALAGKAENADLRAACVGALPRLGKDGEAAILVVLARDDSVTRLACLQHLGKQTRVPSSAVADLVKALADKEADVRVLAAHALGLVGAAARTALPALEKAVKDEDPRVGKVAQKAIGQIKGTAEPFAR